MEKKYISIDQLWKCETCFWMGSDGKCRTDCDTVESYRPAYSKFEFADVAPVVHGEWEWHAEQHGNPVGGMDEDFGYRCSRCKVWADEYGVDGDIYEEPPTNILHYCPNCGAKMDLEPEV